MHPLTPPSRLASVALTSLRGPLVLVALCPEIGGSVGSLTAGRVVFDSAGSADCHALVAAGSSGNFGPDLDETKPDAARVHDLVTKGKGAMPSFADELKSRQIRDVAAFVSESAGR